MKRFPAMRRAAAAATSPRRAIAAILAIAAFGTSVARGQTLEQVGGLAGSVDAVAISGSHAYLGEGSALVVADVSDPSNPVRLGSLSLPAPIREIEAANGLVYVAAQTAGLRIVDVSDPNSPTTLGVVDTPDQALGVAVAGSRALVADDFSGLRVADVSNPAAPSEIGAFQSAERVFGVAASGALAFVLDGGLRIVDVSNAAEPILLSTFDSRGFAQRAEVLGDAVVLADGFDGLQFVDFANPSQPAEISFLDLLGDTADVALSGAVAFAASRAAGVHAVSATDPAAPVLLDSFDTPGLAGDVAAAGDLVYVADGSGGLAILRLRAPAPEPPTGLATLSGPDRVRLDWLANVDPALFGYNVYRADGPGGVFGEALNAEPVTQPQYTDASASLTPGVVYRYRVTALGPGGESPPSAETSARIGTARASLGPVNAPPGEAALVPIVLENASGVSGSAVAFEIAYDPAMLTPTRAMPAGASAGFDFAIAPGAGRGGLSVVRVEGSSAGEGAGSGAFVLVEFAVDPAVPLGSVTETTLVGAELATDSFGGVQLEIELGSPVPVTVSSAFRRGDADGDGDADMLDAARVLRVAAGIETASGQGETTASDLNADGRIDAADATLVLRTAAGLSPEPSDSPVSGGEVAVRVATERASCTGETVEVPVQIDPATRFSGITLDVSYNSDELTFVGMENRAGGEYLADAGFSALPGGEGVVRVALASPQEAVPTDGIVAALRFRLVGGPRPLELPLGTPFSRVHGPSGEDFAARNLVTNSPGRLDAGAVCGTRLVNLSTRGHVGEGDSVLIGGLIVAGDQPRRVLIGGIGPDLGRLGIASPLPNPSLALLAGSSVVAANDDWQNAPNAAAIAATGLRPNDPAEAALLVDLAPGEYTAILSGVGPSAPDRTGVGLVQAFDLGPAVGAGDGGRLANLSTRGAIGAGESVMIAGFAIEGATSKRIFVRGLGPTIGRPPFGVPGALSDPELRLFAMPAGLPPVEIGHNDDWTISPQRAAIEAGGFPPPDPAEPAIVLTLAPGLYTAIVSGEGGELGVGLVEIYEAR